MIGTNNLIPNPEIQVWYKNSDGTEINTHPYIVYDGEDFEVGTYVTNPPSKWMMENGLIVSNGDVITLHVFGKTGMSNVTFIAIS
jgi:hypothetical protein